MVQKLYSIVCSWSLSPGGCWLSHRYIYYCVIFPDNLTINAIYRALTVNEFWSLYKTTKFSTKPRACVWLNTNIRLPLQFIMGFSEFVCCNSVAVQTVWELCLNGCWLLFWSAVPHWQVRMFPTTCYVIDHMCDFKVVHSVHFGSKNLFCTPTKCTVLSTCK